MASGAVRAAIAGVLLAALWLATVGGDAAMIELEQLVAGYDGVAITLR